VIIFGSVRFLSKKVTKPKLFFFWKKNRNRVKPTGFGLVRFFREKTGSNRFGSVFPVLARFSRFWLGFSGLARFFFGFGSVFCLWNRNRTEPAGFFKNLIGLIGFFFGSVFSVIFFPVFSIFRFFYSPLNISTLIVRTSGSILWLSFFFL